MNSKMFGFRLQQLAAAGVLAMAGSAQAQLIINDTLTGASSSFDWKVKTGACLTAGDGTGKIPACVGLPYYSGKTLVGGTTGRLPDAVGSGALRLSNGDTGANTNGNNQTGAVVSNFTFPTTQGIQVTWTSVSYGGNNYNGTGADGLAFFLSDGAQPPTVGAFGGSLGYSCANGKDPSDGVIGGYIGVGIDEYGNFSNPGDNTDSGPGFHAGRISVRGAGSTAWDWLSASPLYSKYYTGTANATAVQKTCASGYAYNYSGSNKVDSTGATISNGNKTHDKLAYNYPVLSYTDVPTGVSLANQQAVNMPTRGAAVPIIFALKITSDGLLDFSYSVNGGATQTVLAGFNITASNGPLPASFRFGFSSGTGGGSNVHEITCFKATPANVGNTSAGSNQQQSGQIVLGGVQQFLAYYHPVNWWGSMTANTLTFDSGNDRLGVQATANWDASCVLTGGACQAMGSSANVTVQAPSSRVMMTWNNATTGAGGVPFEWSSPGISSAEQTTLGTTDRVSYLRGDRTKEISQTGGTFRNRTSVLGDIVDSSPTFVGAPSFDYKGPWDDKLSTTTPPEGTSYATFATNNAGRMNVVYVGANDGFLHGFRAGVVSSDGSSITSNDGKELIAYMPGQVLNAIHPASAALDYSNTAYLHNYYVDATPGTGDLYYNSAWHTWLVGGLGPGGHPGGPVNTNASVDSSNNQVIPDPVGALYALDITDPSSTAFTESNASSVVLGEWNSSTITCTGNATCGQNMGQISGAPLIRRLHDGSWGVIWGNGLNSKTSRAGIFIMHVSSTGAKTIQYIDAGPGPANGIVDLNAADLDGDHITDFVYAGDVLGNLWRFDLTSSTNTNWNTAVTKLFTTTSGQPITTAPLTVETPAVSSSGLPKLMIVFGTGQKLPQTSAAAEIYASGTQSIYGVWDSNMSAWNATTTDEKYDTATGVTLPLTSTSLTAHAMTNVAGIDGSNYRSISMEQVCWKGSTACSSGNTSMGYKLDLPGTGEQIIYNMTPNGDTFTVNTLIPQTTQALTCGVTPASGYTMSIDVANGTGDNAPYTDGSGNFYSGFSQNGAGVVGTYNYNGNTYDGTETNTGGWTSKRHYRRGGLISRVTWTKVR